MKKSFKIWGARIEKDEDVRYTKVVARTTTAALNWICKNYKCELDDIIWLSVEPIDVIVEGEL